jgi:PhoPQ-activated pathogenicity-related protein
MQATETKNKADKEHKTIADLLLSALDMEDEITHSVYSHYITGNNWPANLDQIASDEIQKLLTTLLVDTERHKNILSHLKSRLLDND